MAEIKLTQGRVAIVDNEDVDVLSGFKWAAHWSPLARAFYASSKTHSINGRTCYILMHRHVLSAPVNLHVDHINHDTLDNRKSNLRLCSRSQNLANRTLNLDNISGYKGVSWDSETRKWRVHALVNGKRKALGRFVNAREAAAVYDKAAVEAYGEFALTNRKLGLLV